jgi:glycosyltransferase involved in cell wall biosynthesis
MNDKVLFVIAALNEEKNITHVLLDIKKYFPSSEVLVVDGCSKDKTVEVSVEHGAHVIEVSKYFGIGGAIEAGMLYAFNHKFDVMIRIDADGQHEPFEVLKIYEEFKKKNLDLVIGSRFLGASNYKPNLLRSFAINLIAKLMKLCYGVKITDCTSGCHIYSKRLLTFFARDINFNYSEVSVVCLSHKAGFSIKECFINMQERRMGVSSFGFKNAFFYVFRNIVDVIFTMPFRLKRDEL